MVLDRRFPTATLAAQVFIAGSLVMVLEIAGSRLLTPVYGGSITTWGGLIGVVLSCLSLGYYLGGRLADRLRPRLLLTNLLLFSSIFVIATPALSWVVLRAFNPLVFDEKAGVVLSALTILGPPTIMLGAVSPVAMKILTRELERLGSAAGNLYALSTIGSIFGTFLTTFVLVPIAEISSIFYFSGIVLMSSSLLSPGGRRLFAVFAIAAVLLYPSGLAVQLTCLSSYIGDIKHREESLYNQIIVLDRGGERFLYLNGLVHSAMDIDDPYRLVLPYTTLFTLGPALVENASSVLFLGGGGFSGPKYFLKNYEGMRIDVVEIDPRVVAAAERFFNVTQDPRLGIYISDGRRYLAAAEKTYDVVIMDVYSKNYIPFHMLTLEYLVLLKSRMRSDGVVISNIIASLDGPTSDILRAAYKTFRSVFRSVVLIPVSSTSPLSVQNIMLVASDRGSISREGLTSLAYDRGGRLHGAAIELLDNVVEEVETGDVPLLTDAYAPVENMLNPITGSRFGEEYYLGVIGPSSCA